MDKAPLELVDCVAKASDALIKLKAADLMLQSLQDALGEREFEALSWALDELADELGELHEGLKCLRTAERGAP